MVMRDEVIEKIQKYIDNRLKMMLELQTRINWNEKQEFKVVGAHLNHVMVMFTSTNGKNMLKITYCYLTINDKIISDNLSLL